MPDLYARLQDVWRSAQIYKNVWLRIINQFGKAYRMATENVINHRPKYSPRPDPDFPWPVGMSAVTVGLTNLAIGSPAAAGVRMIAYMVKPIVDGVDSLIVKAGQPLIDASAMPLTSKWALSPNEYEAVYDASIRDFFDDVMKAVHEAIKATRNRAFNIDRGEYDRIERMLLRSPYWHRPTGYRNWTYDRIEPEIEKSLWAEWARRLPLRGEKFYQASPVIAFDFRPTLSRLKEGLKVDLPARIDPRLIEMHEKLGQRMLVESWRFQVAVELKKWGESYTPHAKFGSPLPPPVQHYLRESLAPIIRQASSHLSRLKLTDLLGR